MSLIFAKKSRASSTVMAEISTSVFFATRTAALSTRRRVPWQVVQAVFAMYFPYQRFMPSDFVSRKRRIRRGMMPSQVVWNWPPPELPLPLHFTR